MVENADTKQSIHQEPQKQILGVKATDHIQCDNVPVDSDSLKRVLVKIPVVLAELTVQFNVSSTIWLPEPAIEIKRVGKRLKVTQCRLLQNTNKLFIQGFVRKNIEFATRKISNAESICRNISHCTVDVPFSGVTAVDFNFLQPAPARVSTAEEFRFLVEQDLGPEFPAKDQLLSNDLTQFNQVTTEYFNELVFCELISATITEFNEALDREPPHGDAPFEELQFESFLEKMVIDLTLKLLQKRQVYIS